MLTLLQEIVKKPKGVFIVCFSCIMTWLHRKLHFRMFCSPWPWNCWIIKLLTFIQSVCILKVVCWLSVVKVLSLYFSKKNLRPLKLKIYKTTPPNLFIHYLSKQVRPLWNQQKGPQHQEESPLFWWTNRSLILINEMKMTLKVLELFILRWFGTLWCIITRTCVFSLYPFQSLCCYLTCDCLILLSALPWHVHAALPFWFDQLPRL